MRDVLDFNGVSLMGTLARFDLNKLIEQYGTLHFVETGTGSGDGIAHAMRFGFRTLWSCESVPQLAAATSAAFEIDNRVRIINAKSVDFLLDVCASIPVDEPILFWLDAHFPGADYGLATHGAEQDPAIRLPLRSELEVIIKQRTAGRDVLLADDLRIWIDAAFGSGNLPASVRPFCPRERDASFFADMLGSTHEVKFDFTNEGYVIVTPRPLEPAAPFTLLPKPAITDMIALAQNAPPGEFVEIGVYQGGSAWHLARIARERGCELHLFDTFNGIPEKDEQDSPHVVGDFSDTSLEHVKTVIPDAHFHVGVFPLTLPPDLKSLAFVHVDCDQYRCCCEAIRRLYPLLVNGGVMLFDDYSFVTGVTQAVDDWFGTAAIYRTAQGKAYVVSGVRESVA